MLYAGVEISWRWSLYSTKKLGAEINDATVAAFGFYASVPNWLDLDNTSVLLQSKHFNFHKVFNANVLASFDAVRRCRNQLALESILH